MLQYLEEQLISGDFHQSGTSGWVLLMGDLTASAKQLWAFSPELSPEYQQH